MAREIASTVTIIARKSRCCCNFLSVRINVGVMVLNCRIQLLLIGLGWLAFTRALAPSLLCAFAGISFRGLSAFTQLFIQAFNRWLHFPLPISPIGDVSAQCPNWSPVPRLSQLARRRHLLCQLCSALLTSCLVVVNSFWPSGVISSLGHLH